MSRESLKENPDIVIWSETSFVPSIDWHSRYRTDPEIYEIVRDLLDFLSSQKVPYLIGNGEGRMVYDERGVEKRIDYNSAMLYEKGEKKGVYRKTHLVPFTEHFPYKRQLPWLYDILEKADTHFWEKGTEYTVFESSGVKFSTPICFEDTFGYISRRFIAEGAEVIVNISNDSWSASVAAEEQHMIHAVFRAAENRRSVVRSTNGGITCIIDPNGKIVTRIAPFTEDYLVADVPVYTGSSTLYSMIGDSAGALAVLAGIILLSAASVLHITRRQHRSRD
jgi:apolipoprotein N-acyltransferase